MTFFVGGSRIEYEVPSEERAMQIYNAICINNRFDFGTLDPPSFQAYCDALGKNEEERDIFEEKTYDSGIINIFHKNKVWKISDLEWHGGTAAFNFTIALSVPYPVIVAFGNKFKVPFTLKYYARAYEHWGIERYELDENGWIKNISERFTLLEDRHDLHLELFGCELEEE